VSRVAAGAVAKKLIAHAFGGRVLAYVKQVGDIVAHVPSPEEVTLEQIEATPVRCPDRASAQRMIERIEEVRKAKDSIGGVAEIVATSVPAGLGEPVFDKLKADLGKALFSLPAVLGVEYGIGFGCATMRGSENNDLYEPGDPATLATRTNRHGGMLGGISSGMPIVLRAAVKPTSSLPRQQPTVDRMGNPATIVTIGRHDPANARGERAVGAPRDQPLLIDVEEELLSRVRARERISRRLAGGSRRGRGPYLLDDTRHRLVGPSHGGTPSRSRSDRLLHSRALRAS
jgi:chorismate synthase